jgi:hypothetical protein
MKLGQAYSGIAPLLATTGEIPLFACRSLALL